MIKLATDTLNRLEVLSELISGYKLVKENFIFLLDDNILRHYEEFTDNKNALSITTEYMIYDPEMFISMLESKGIKVKHRKNLDYDKLKNIIQQTNLNPRVIITKFNDISCEIQFLLLAWKAYGKIHDKNKNTLEFRIEKSDCEKRFICSIYENMLIEYDHKTNSPNRITGEGFTICKDDPDSSYYEDNASSDIKFLFINDNRRNSFDKVLDYIFNKIDDKRNFKTMYKVADIAVELLKEKTTFDV